VYVRGVVHDSGAGAPGQSFPRFLSLQEPQRVLALVIVCTMVTAYTAAQLTASGKAFASFLGTSYAVGAVIGAAVILYLAAIMSTG
jgi:Na+/proline symporter